MKQQDPRFVFDGYRNTIGIAVKRNNENSIYELQELTEVFKIQDTLRFQSAEDILESYNHTGGEMIIVDDRTIHRNINPELVNITLQEALEKREGDSLFLIVIKYNLEQ